MKNKPIIGIVARPDNDGKCSVLYTTENYRLAIIKSGGIPITILPPQLVEYSLYNPKELVLLSQEEKEMLITQVNMCDGILMPGGKKRYEYDRFITSYCLEQNIPILGICLGMQLLATHMNRDTLVYTDEDLSHSKPGINEVHTIKLNKDSKLFEIIGVEEFSVNSRHKFKVTDIGEFEEVGNSSDGTIEAIEHKDKKFAIGVQWHPEDLMDTIPSQNLFKSFIDVCSK